jgi:hypothetical protein
MRRPVRDLPPSEPDIETPQVSVTLDPLYHGFYVEGLRRVFGRVRWRTPPVPGLSGMAFEVGGRRFHICARDDASIDDAALAWCDVFGKVNARDPRPDKVVAIGPSCGVTAWSPWRGLAATASSLVLRSEHSPVETLANFRRQWRDRRPETALVPGPTDPSRVFFASTIWRNEPETNAARATFLQTVRSRPELTVEGGFAPRRNGPVPGFDDLVAPRVDYPTYLEATRRSAFVFNTPAVSGCHGWKLAEYLALGKAIISTPLTNLMPAPFRPGEHYHLVDPTPDSIAAAVDALADGGYRRHLEHHARRYYLDHLAPEAVIRRLLGWLNGG